MWEGAILTKSVGQLALQSHRGFEGRRDSFSGRHCLSSCRQESSNPYPQTTSNKHPRIDYDYDSSMFSIESDIDPMGDGTPSLLSACRAAALLDPLTRSQKHVHRFCQGLFFWWYDAYGIRTPRSKLEMLLILTPEVP